MDVNARPSSRLCYRYLDRHPSEACSLKGSCKECGNITHHSLLHHMDGRNAFLPLSEPSKLVLNPETLISSINIQSLSCQLVSKDKLNLILLSTAKILAIDGVGQYHIVQSVLIWIHKCLQSL